MDGTKVEIMLNEEIVFGLYADNNLLVKDDPECLATARERLTAALECLSDYGESPRAIGQVS